MGCDIPRSMQIIFLRGFGAAVLTAGKVWYTLDDDEDGGSATASSLARLGRVLAGKSRSNRGFLLLRGCLGATAISLYFFAIKMMLIGDAVAIFFTNPVFIMCVWGPRLPQLGFTPAPLARAARSSSPSSLKLRR
eukprot:scaffold218_cov333-Prasinococcus_capsulatus_cf.AAC.15